VNATDQARSAYAGHALRTARQAEHHVFATVTARLALAAHPAAEPARVAAAVGDNRRLWTRLAADVASPGNGLPAPLRARLFWLAEFTEHHSRLVLRGEAGLQPLIDVNTAVMRGLAGVPPAPAPVAVAAEGPR
jgi:flagellar protein FlaF